MSKRIESKINCPVCGNQFDFTLYRTIWGEYPENRDLVMSNKINVATCPNCKKETKLEFPFMYTNSKLQFAVWWEPVFDLQIGRDSEGYVQLMGAGNYLATAPRVKDWNDFKDTILKFESGELKANPVILSTDMKNNMRDFIDHIKEKNKKKKSGCLGTLLFFVLGVLIIISSITVFI
jgi:transcription elongation factor Elf1